MYSNVKPIFPKLHRCHFCKKRLNGNMPIVSKMTWWGDGCTYDYYCSEHCAAKEKAIEKAKEREIDELNERIENGV